MRVVFDTNIFLSALAIPGSRAEQAVHRIFEGSDVLYLSTAIIDEVLSVLSSKFGGDRETLSSTAVSLAEMANLVKPTNRRRVLNDEADNRILECALAARADVIVTGDKAMLQLGTYQSVRIISLKEYLED